MGSDLGHDEDTALLSFGGSQWSKKEKEFVRLFLSNRVGSLVMCILIEGMIWDYTVYFKYLLLSLVESDLPAANGTREFTIAGVSCFKRYNLFSIRSALVMSLGRITEQSGRFLYKIEKKAYICLCFAILFAYYMGNVCFRRWRNLWSCGNSDLVFAIRNCVYLFVRFVF